MNSFNKERNACFGVAFLLMFMIGIYLASKFSNLVNRNTDNKFVKIFV